MSGWKRFAGFSACGLIALMAVSATASAKTLVVSPGQSIQHKIDKARSGDTVLVSAGTYHGSLQIRNGIRLRGQGAVLKPGPGNSLCNQFSGGRKTGVCVLGHLKFQHNQPKIVRRVANVTISGLRIRGFSGDGLFAFGTRDLRVRNNHFVDNGGYGAFSLAGKQPHYVHNIARANHAPGLYMGDSPKAHAVVRSNRSVGNAGEGILLRHVTIGRATHNVVSRNCTGLMVLADAPGPAGSWLVAGNRVIDNNKACGGDPDEGIPPQSGIGIILFGAHDTVVRNNVVRGQRHAHRSIASGGIVVMRGIRGTAPKHDRIAHNIALGNRPDDIVRSGGGSVRFFENLCRTSDPRRICR